LLILHSRGPRGAVARIFIPARRDQPTMSRPTVEAVS
jgi:hypothetical protein